MAKSIKQAQADARAKVEAENKIFWLYEFIQRAEDGGHPVPNDANLGHGEPVYVVKKRELMEFAQGVKDIVLMLAKATASTATLDTIMLAAEAEKIATRILAEDMFVQPIRKLGTPKNGDQ
jgi:hypothetical protein